MRSLQPIRGGRELAPASNLRNFFSRFEDMFSDFEKDFSMEPRWPSTNLASLAEFAPSVDIEESDEMYMISADLPGMKKDDVKIDITGNSLRLSGERNREVNEEGYRERSYGRFSRSFTLPQNIDAKKVEANFEDGVLRIVLPKTEISKAQAIKIESGQPKGLIDRFLQGEKNVESTQEKSKH